MWNRLKQEAGVGEMGVDTVAAGEEECKPVVVGMEGAEDELGMELFEVVEGFNPGGR